MSRVQFWSLFSTLFVSSHLIGFMALRKPLTWASSTIKFANMQRPIFLMFQNKRQGYINNGDISFSPGNTSDE